MVLCSNDRTSLSTLYCFSLIQNFNQYKFLTCLIEHSQSDVVKCFDLVLLVDIFIVSQKIQLSAGEWKQWGEGMAHAFRAFNSHCFQPLSKVLYLLTWIYQLRTGSANYGTMNNNTVLERRKPQPGHRCGFQPLSWHQLGVRLWITPLIFMSLRFSSVKWVGCIRSVVLKLECATESTGGLVKTQITGPHPQIWQGLGWGLDKLPF